MSESLSTIKGLVGSLRGASVRPLNGNYSGVIAIPEGFRKEGETGTEVAYRYIEHLYAQDALQDALPDTAGPEGTICD